MVLSSRLCQRFNRRERLNRLAVFFRARLWLLFCLHCSLVGCWQEVRYEPEGIATARRAASDVEDASLTTPQPAPEVLPPAPPVTETDARAETDAPTESIAAPQMLPAEASETEASETATADQAAEESMEGLATSTAPALDPAILNPGEQAELPAPGTTSTLPTAVEPRAVDDAPVDDGVPTARTALATWKMSSEWSMAAALQAKGQTAQRFGKHLESAKQEAQFLGVELPELPEQTEESNQLEVNVSYLLEDAGPQFAGQLNAKLGVEHAALAELAAKTHVLLLSYVPTSTRLEPVIAAIERCAKDSGLPESVWGELTALLARRASFQEVKAAIFRLHEEAGAHLTERIAGPELE